MSSIDKPIDTESKLVVSRGWQGLGAEEWGVLANGYRVSLGVMKMSRNYAVVMVAQL